MSTPYKHDNQSIDNNSISQQTPSSAGKPMSSSLKERLKRSGRYHASPLTSRIRDDTVIPINSPGNSELIVSKRTTENAVKNLDFTDGAVKDCDTKSKLLSKRDSISKICGASAVSNLHDNLASDYKSIKTIDTNDTRFVNDAAHNIHNTSTNNEHRLMNANIEAAGNVKTDKCDAYENMSQMQLSNLIQEKSELLRKLKLVEKHRKENTIQELTQLTDKWRDACQQAIQDLHKHLGQGSLGQGSLTISDLIQQLRLDTNLIHYDTEEDTFY